MTQPAPRLASLADARADPDGRVVLQGDWGGQIYVVARAAQVACDEAALGRLLRELDALAWPGSDASGAEVSYERLREGERVPGGMGGGEVTGEVWVHAELRGYEGAIREVLAGRRVGIGAKGAAGERLPGEG